MQEAIIICSVKILYAAVVVVELLELAWVSEGTPNGWLGVKYGNKKYDTRIAIKQLLGL